MAGLAIVWLIVNPKKRSVGLGAITLTGGPAGVIGPSLFLPLAFTVPRLGGPDYMGGYYGFDDLVLLWFISLALGLGLGVLWFKVLSKRWPSSSRKAGQVVG